VDSAPSYSRRSWLVERRLLAFLTGHAPGREIEPSTELKGDFYVTDRAHYYPAARVRRRWWLLRISEMGDRRRRRDFRAGPDHSGALLRVRRNAYAPLKFRGGLVVDRPEAPTNWVIFVG
jgi:hypothetical protein